MILVHLYSYLSIFMILVHMYSYFSIFMILVHMYSSPFHFHDVSTHVLFTYIVQGKIVWSVKIRQLHKNG